MDKITKNKHLSDMEINLYCDKQLGHKDMLKVTKHLKSCESCSRLVVEAQKFAGLLYKALESDLSIERKENCLNDMDISAYMENRVTTRRRMAIEKHLSKCGYCLNVVFETKKAIKEGIKEEEQVISSEKLMGVVKQQLREQKDNTLLEKFNFLVKNSPVNIRKHFERIKNGIEVIFKDIFAYPSPQFSPVFGEHKANVLSPFGKVRYPIIFEWLSYREANQYIVSIEDIGWSYKTSETKIKINEKQLKLDYGREYMWELRVTKGEDIIDEITGFFSLETENEIKELLKIEKQLKSIKPMQDRLILLGGILEEKGFYMDAIEQYKKAYALEPLSGIAYRIAYCYDKLELEELRDEWNKKIRNEE